MEQEIMNIKDQREIADNIYEITLEGDLVDYMDTPGQFINIKIPSNDLILRRPISLAYINKEDRTCKIIYKIVGEGTLILSKLKKNDKLDILGPLGNGFEIDFIEKDDIVFLIGGGLGVPPLYELSRMLKNKGAKIISLFGFDKKSSIFYEEEFKKEGKLYYSTMDGSYGVKGTVEELLKTVVKDIKPKAVYSCGPKGLLKMVDNYPFGCEDVYLSYESRMACGIGVCFACVCKSYEKDKENYEVKKICCNGPVFKSGEIEYE